MMMAFAIHFNLFPVFVELKSRSNWKFMQASIAAALFMFFSCSFLGICGSVMFGDDVDADFLRNLEQREGTVFIICRISFCLVLIVHVPYIFYAAKECLLVSYDEIVNGSLSKKIDAKLALVNNKSGANTEE